MASHSPHAAPQGQARARPSRSPARSGGAATDSLLVSLLSRFAGIVGDKAAAATFHFAAIQEGLEVGRARTREELGDVLQAAATLLGHRIEVSEGPDWVQVLVADGLLPTSPVLEAVVRGLYEGALRGHSGLTYTCELEAEADWTRCMLRKRG